MAGLLKMTYRIIAWLTLSLALLNGPAFVAEAQSQDLRVQYAAIDSTGAITVHLSVPRGRAVDSATLTIGGATIEMSREPAPLGVTWWFLLDASDGMLNKASPAQAAIGDLLRGELRDPVGLLIYDERVQVLQPTTERSQLEATLSSYAATPNALGCVADALATLGEQPPPDQTAWRILLVSGPLSRQGGCDRDARDDLPLSGVPVDVIVIADEVDDAYLDIAERSGGTLRTADIGTVDTRMNEIRTLWADPIYALSGQLAASGEDRGTINVILDDGSSESVDARFIQIEAPEGEGSGAAPALEMVATSTPVPTNTPAPTFTALPTNTPAPTLTSAPTDPAATEAPPTDVPPTDVPPTDVPPTDVLPTDVPATETPEPEPTESVGEVALGVLGQDDPTEAAPTDAARTEATPAEATPTNAPATETIEPEPTDAITETAAAEEEEEAAPTVVAVAPVEPGGPDDPAASDESPPDEGTSSAGPDETPADAPDETVATDDDSATDQLPLFIGLGAVGALVLLGGVVLLRRRGGSSDAPADHDMQFEHTYVEEQATRLDRPAPASEQPTRLDPAPGLGFYATNAPGTSAPQPATRTPAAPPPGTEQPTLIETGGADDTWNRSYNQEFGSGYAGSDEDEDLLITSVLSDAEFMQMQQASTDDVVAWIRLNDDDQSSDHELRRAGATVGRRSSCDIVVKGDSAVSGEHARFIVDDAGRVSVTVLSKTNPVVVSGVVVKLGDSRPLQPQDVIQLSPQTRLVFIARDENSGDFDDERTQI